MLRPKPRSGETMLYLVEHGVADLLYRVVKLDLVEDHTHQGELIAQGVMVVEDEGSGLTSAQDRAVRELLAVYEPHWVTALSRVAPW